MAVLRGVAARAKASSSPSAARRGMGSSFNAKVTRGVEALAGVTHDPSLGPLLVAGVGGVAVEHAHGAVAVDARMRLPGNDR